MESTQQGSQDQKDDQERHPQPKTVPVPGCRKRLTILMKPHAQPTTSSNPKTTVDSVTVGCPLSLFGHIQPRHWRTLSILVWSHTDLVLLAEEPVQFCPLVRSAPQASLRGGYSVDWATGIITRGISGVLWNS